jgi:hypothetical protein
MDLRSFNPNCYGGHHFCDTWASMGPRHVDGSPMSMREYNERSDAAERRQAQMIRQKAAYHTEQLEDRVYFWRTQLQRYRL